MNILPKKLWHVRRKENIFRVITDEKQAAVEEEAKQRRIQLAERESRLKYLRARNREGEDAVVVPGEYDEETSNQVAEHSSIAVANIDSNVYENEERRKEKQDVERLKLMTKFGVAADSRADSQYATPWWKHSWEKRRFNDEQSELDPKNKKFVRYHREQAAMLTDDPFSQFKSKLISSSNTSSDCRTPAPSERNVTLFPSANNNRKEWARNQPKNSRSSPPYESSTRKRRYETDADVEISPNSPRIDNLDEKPTVVWTPVTKRRPNVVTPSGGAEAENSEMLFNHHERSLQRKKHRRKVDADDAQPPTKTSSGNKRPISMQSSSTVDNSSKPSIEELQRQRFEKEANARVRAKALLAKTMGNR